MIKGNALPQIQIIRKWAGIIKGNTLPLIRIIRKEAGISKDIWLRRHY